MSPRLTAATSLKVPDRNISRGDLLAELTEQAVLWRGHCRVHVHRIRVQHALGVLLTRLTQMATATSTSRQSLLTGWVSPLRRKPIR